MPGEGGAWGLRAFESMNLTREGDWEPDTTAVSISDSLDRKVSISSSTSECSFVKTWDERK